MSDHLPEVTTDAKLHQNCPSQRPAVGTSCKQVQGPLFNHLSNQPFDTFSDPLVPFVYVYVTQNTVKFWLQAQGLYNFV